MPFSVTKLTIFSLSTFFLSIGILCQAKAQQCIETIDLKGIEAEKINWEQFPEFSLPFEIIYGPPIQHDQFREPLQHGFSQLADQNYLNRVAQNKQAQIYYGTAFVDAKQPWEKFRSPWENNMSLYAKKWQNDFARLAAQAGSPNTIDPDIFCFDIERIWRFDHEILQLKSKPGIPESYRNLDNALFLKQYKTDMRKLYAQALRSVLEKGKDGQTRVASYADSPIVNTFENIQGRSWHDWQTNKSALNFLCTDENGNVGGEFYNQLDIVTPSAYYYYDYPHVFAGEYLSYLLFQIEANKAWTNKPIIPFVWLRYSFNPNYVNQYIRPWMAEATAIFPFFSGAKGLWLWENPSLFYAEKQFSTYAYFIRGLYRLSQVKHFFESDNELVIQTSARDYNENQEVIWRGVVKGNEILVAAHNPFAASETEEKVIGVSYKNWSGSIRLVGHETRLCVFDMNVLSKEIPETNALEVYPNPVSDRFLLSYQAKKTQKARLRMLSLDGQILNEQELQLHSGKNEFELRWPTETEPQLLVELLIENKPLVKKLIRH